MSITEKEIRSAASPGERRTLEYLRDTEQGAVKSTQYACGCTTHTRDDGTQSTFVHTGAPKGHKPAGATTDVTRSAHSRQKAVRNAPERPKTVTRSKPVAPLTPAQAISATQAEIRNLTRKGDSRTLLEDRVLKTLHRRAAKLNAEQLERSVAEVKRAAEKMRARRAQRADTIDVMHATRAELRDASLEVLERDGGHLSPHQLDAVDSLVRNVDEYTNPVTIAKRLLTTENPAYRSAFQKAMHPASGTAAVFTQEEQAAVTAYRAMSEGSLATGGYGVPVLVDPTIIPSAGASAAPVMSLATVVTVTTDKWAGVTAAVPSFQWRGEAAVSTDDSPTLAQPVINVYESTAWVPFSYEILADYPSFAEEMQGLLSRGFTDTVANSTIAGTGSSQPWGVFPRMMATTTSPSHIVVTTAGQLSSATVQKAWQNLPQRWRANATWLGHSSTETLLKGFASGQSQVDYAQTLTESGVRISALEGRPFISTDYAPDFAGHTAGTVAAAVVGDFTAGFRVIVRAGLDVELVKGPVPNIPTSNVPTMQRGYLAYARLGHDAVVNDAFRVIANA